MSQKYSMLLSPLKVGGTYLKSRMSFPVAPVHFLQGPETWPAEGYLTFYTNMARNGCAYINMGEWNNPTQRTEGKGDSLRMQYFNTDDPSTENYISQFGWDIKMFGSKVCLNGAGLTFPEGYSLNGGPAMGGAPGAAPKMTQMAPTEMVDEACENFIAHLKKYKSFGYDMASAQMGGGPMGMMGRSARTDKYADSSNLMKQLYIRAKEELGSDYLFEAIVSGGNIPQLIAQCKEYEGIVDIVTIRENDIAKSHPTSFTFKKYEHGVVQYARELKAAGVKQAIGINGGLQDLDEIEGYLEDGTCDIISMGRAFFADSEYLKKAQEGRGDDVRPCVWCNKCHGTMSAPWMTFCTVNPLMGQEHKLHRLVQPVEREKKVAVIGGGVAGLEAAMDTAKRGHKVTLYEKTGYLGGQLLHAEYFSFKWSLKDFKDWQVRQCEKLGVQFVMNCAPTREMLEAEGYDAIIACTGAVPKVPKYAAAEDGSLKEGLWSIPATWGHESELGHKVVICGGSETGVEEGMYLGENGHEVIVLTRQSELASDSPKLHYITMSWVDASRMGGGPGGPGGGAPGAGGPGAGGPGAGGPDAGGPGAGGPGAGGPGAPEGEKKEAKQGGGGGGFDAVRPEWEKPLYHLTGITDATTVSVTPNSVTYRKDGVETTIECDSVVICGGMRACVDEAIAYSGLSAQFFMAGDCEAVGNIQRCTRSAYGKSIQI